MPVRVTCPCGESYEVDADLAGKAVLCRGCGERAAVPYDLPPDAGPRPPGDRRAHAAVPSIRCPGCGCDGEVEPTDRRVALTCPDCALRFHVRFYDGQPAVVFDRPSPNPGRSRKSAPRSTVGTTMGVLALVVSAGFILAAVAASRSANDYDRREAEAADSSNRLGISLALAAGDYRPMTMREGRTADRTGVYLAVVGGVIFGAVGLVCLATPGWSSGHWRARA